MRYYLSYLETTYARGNTHTTLMVSAQEDESSPIKMIYEIGFDGIVENGFAWTTFQGVLEEESNIGRALYSKNSQVKHRTYELSKEKMEQFFIIINRDRRLNISTSQDEKDPTKPETIGGPDYCLIGRNCKKYALDLLEELGITEKDRLSNYFIQRPGSTTSLLKMLSGNDISCPIKDKFLEEITSVLTQLNEIMKLHFKSDEDKIADNQTRDDIQDILCLSEKLLKTKEKLGIDKSTYNTFTQLVNFLNKPNLYTYIKEINDVKLKLETLLKDAKEIIDLSAQNKLEFIWNQTPILQKGTKFKNLIPEDKALCIIKIQTSKMLYKLQSIVPYLNEHINLTHATNPDLSQDLINLKGITETFKNQLVTQDKLFLSLIDGLSSEQLIYQCVQQSERLKDILTNFSQAIANFTPKTAETNIVMRWFKILLHHIHHDFFSIENAVSVIKDKKHAAKQANNRLGSKMGSSNYSRFFTTYTPTDRGEPTTSLNNNDDEQHLDSETTTHFISKL